MTKLSLHNLYSHGLSDVGLVRFQNEDDFYISNDYGFYALADGMGGHNAGDIASKEAIRFLTASVEEFISASPEILSIEEVYQHKRLWIQNANNWVHHLGVKRKSFHGLGTTITTLLFYRQRMIYSHIGDSRIYRLRGNKLLQMTQDHSLLNELLLSGKLEKKDIKKFSKKNVLTKALGTHKSVDPEINVSKVFKDDLYLLCSDGLSDQVSYKEIFNILTTTADLKSMAINLVATSKTNGGNDNVTVVLVSVR